MNQSIIQKIDYLKSTISYHLDVDKKPLLYVNSGDTVVIETMNAFSQETETEEQLNEVIARGFHHPFTGPIFINGAEPGKTLEVIINNIELSDYAYTCISRSSGVLKGKFKNRNYKKIKIEGDHFYFDNKKIKIEPNIGGMGLADPNGTRNGATCKYGGNLDVRWTAAGTSLFLPIAVSGGLLYMGDVHALQGNGEVSGIALESSGKIEVTLQLHDSEIPCPIVKTNKGNLIFGYGETLEEAVELATTNAMGILAKSLNMSQENAYMLLSCTSDLIIGHLTGRIKSVAILVSDEVLSIGEII